MWILITEKPDCLDLHDFKTNKKHQGIIQHKSEFVKLNIENHGVAMLGYKAYNLSHGLFDLILCVPVNICLVISERIFLYRTSSKQRLMYLAQGHNAVPLMRLPLSHCARKPKLKQFISVVFYDNYKRPRLLCSYKINKPQVVLRSVIVAILGNSHLFFHVYLHRRFSKL